MAARRYCGFVSGVAIIGLALYGASRATHAQGFGAGFPGQAGPASPFGVRPEPSKLTVIPREVVLALLNAYDRGQYDQFDTLASRHAKVAANWLTFETDAQAWISELPLRPRRPLIDASVGLELAHVQRASWAAAKLLSMAPMAAAARRSLMLWNLADRYSGLVDDPAVSAEAHLRLGQTLVRLARPTVALAEFAKAEQTTDVSVRYLAHLFAGAVNERIGQRAQAISSLSNALRALPRAQSATFALAPLLLEAGQPEMAAEIMDAAVAQPPVPDPLHDYWTGDPDRWLHAGKRFARGAAMRRCACRLLQLFVLSVTAAAAAAAAAAVPAAQTPPAPVFRSVSTLVSLSVSVKRAGRVVTGLTPADFTVLDNGVRQEVSRLSFEEVPVDTTVIVDVSGSTKDAWQRIRRDAERIIGALRPIDRIRILAIDTYVREVIPMQPAGGVKLPAQTDVGGVSPVRDALSAALIGRSDPERRRLVVAITDASDTKSITEAPMLFEVARRSDSVLHVVAVPVSLPVGFGSPSGPPARVMTLGFSRDAPTKAEWELLDKAAEVTGGAIHGFDPGDAQNGDAVRVFRNVFNDFKQSYVVQYNAETVTEGGWHEVAVRVRGVDPVGVRARKGYFGAGR